MMEDQEQPQMYCDKCHDPVVSIQGMERKVGGEGAISAQWKHEKIGGNGCNRLTLTDEQVTDVDWNA